MLTSNEERAAVGVRVFLYRGGHRLEKRGTKGKADFHSMRKGGAVRFSLNDFQHPRRRKNGSSLLRWGVLRAKAYLADVLSQTGQSARPFFGLAATHVRREGWDSAPPA